MRMIRTIEKYLVLAILLYLNWFQYVFGVHQVILYIAALLLAGLLVLDTMEQKTIVVSSMPKIVLTYIFFGVYAFVTGAVVATNKSVFLSTIVQYFEYAFVCYAMYHISKEENNMRWVLGALYITAAVCALQTVFFGKTSVSSGVYVITISPSNNPNTLGMMMVFGVMAVLFDYRRIQKHFLMLLISLLVFGYVTMLTGSRKSFISVGILLAGWVVNYVLYARKSGRRITNKGWKGFLQNAAIVVGILGVLIYMSSSAFSQTSILTRLLKLFGSSDLASSERVNLYVQAVEFFKEHPVFGIGYRQFEVLYEMQYYSHSTYAEILSCTGVVGTVIFFAPIVWLTVKLTARAFARTNGLSYKYRMLFLMLAVELLVSATQIAIYDLGHMTVYTFIFWEFDQLERVRTETAVIRLQMIRRLRLTAQRSVGA